MDVQDVAVMAETRRQSVPNLDNEKTGFEDHTAAFGSQSTEGLIEPTAEELVTLRRVSGKIPWTVGHNQTHKSLECKC